MTDKMEKICEIFEEAGYGLSPVEVVKDEVYLLNRFLECMVERVCYAFMVPKEYWNRDGEWIEK